MTAVVTLYGRPQCHLCDEARAELESMREAGASFELDEIDIEHDQQLLARYLERIPVIAVDGQVVCDLGLDVEGVMARLATVSP
ncbi:MAG: glutaredoxin family protein [Actinomycetota bacterium]|nr:glutaredoxin family protein [Actinomycetota bacterium]